MQGKCNEALRHFYQPSRNLYDTDANEDFSDLDEAITRMKPKSFNGKQGQSGYHKLQNSDDDFMGEEARIKQIQPKTCCSTRSCILLLVWTILFVCAVLGLTFFVLIVVNKGQSKDAQNSFYLEYRDLDNSTTKASIVSCDDFKITKVWHSNFEKLQTETAVRFIDVNDDGIDDPVIAFGTGVDGYNVKRIVCDLYFNGTYPCFGGALALDGTNGRELWRHYSGHEIYAVNCNGDIDQDGVPDCLLGGRGGMFNAISGKNGKLLWAFWDDKVRSTVMNLYTAQFIKDLNHDGVMEVLQVHGGDPLAEAYSEKRLVGRILIFSGKSGRVLRWVDTPDKKESYFSPLLYTLKNGTDIVIFGTGGETHGGSLYVIQLNDLYYGRIQNARSIYTDEHKGVMNPPVLVDLNKDGTVDMVSAFFNSTVAAFDGESFSLIWSYSLDNSESYSIPAAGYFNNDDTPDFMARFNVGEGFPVYYHSLLNIIDGASGKPILDKPYKASATANTSPLTISMEGRGNDLFLYWVADCLGHEGEGGEFVFVKGTNVHEQSRADTCTLRYNTKGFSRFSVMNRKMAFPGATIYNSETYKDFEKSLPLQKENGNGIHLRAARHIGVPDHGGIQRLIATAGITSALQGKSDHGALANSIDVVFPVYWMYPAKTRILTAKDRKCVEDYRKKHSGEKPTVIAKDKFFDEGDAAVNFCLKDKTYGKNRIYQSQSTYDPRNIHLGTLTVYRFNIKCICKNLRPDQKCARMLPVEQQGWGGYMGSFANGFFNEHRQS